MIQKNCIKLIKLTLLHRFSLVLRWPMSTWVRNMCSSLAVQSAACRSRSLWWSGWTWGNSPSMIWMVFYSVNQCRKLLSISVLVFSLVSRYWAPFLRQGIRNMVDSENGRRTQFVKMTGKSYLLPMQYGVKIVQVAPIVQWFYPV